MIKQETMTTENEMTGRRTHSARFAHRVKCAAAAVCLPALCALLLCACGSEKTVEVSIRDRNITTQLEVPEGSTVAEVIEAAEIRLGGEDEVKPAPDTAVGAEGQTADGGVEIIVQRHVHVSVDDEGKVSELELVGGTVEDALKEAKVRLGRDDYVDHDQDEFLSDGMKITVTHVRHITLTVNGEKRKLKTTARTVKELFKEQKIKVGKNDRLNVRESLKLKDGTKIVLDLVNVKEETVTEEIPFSTETSYSAAMNKGTSKVSRAGVRGQKEVTYRITIVNGKEESREKVSEKIVKQPVNQVVVQGTKAAKTVVSRQAVYDCDGSGHGYYIIKYSDGTTTYQEF